MAELKIVDSLEELEGMDINGCGVVPFSYSEGDLYFLFGREAKDIRWAEKGLWGDFGGSINRTKESNFEGMIREFWEETNGIFGKIENIENYVKENFEKMLFIYSPVYRGVILLLPVEYDKNLPKYFNLSYSFSKILVDSKKELAKVRNRGLLEKDTANWFTIADLKKNLKKFRKCDSEIIQYLFDNFNPKVEEKKEPID